MVYVQFQYLYRKRKIFIEGQVDDRTFNHIKLLKKMSDRFYLDKIIDFFIRVFCYENQEMGSILIILITTLATQILSHFFFNTMSQNGVSHLILSVMICFFFIDHILIRKQYRLYVAGILEVIFGIGVGIVKGFGYEDFGITVWLLVINTLGVIICILRRVSDEELEEKMFSIFQFESNFLLAIYLAGKAFQIAYPYFILNTPLDAWNLIPVVISLMVINSLKIWHLFDYNPVYLIGQLMAVYNKDTQQIEKASYFLKSKKLIQGLNLETPKSSQQEEKQKNKYKKQKLLTVDDIIQIEASSNFDSKKTSVHTNNIPSNSEPESSLGSVKEDDEQIVQSNSSSQSEQQENLDQPFTSFIALPLSVNFAWSALLIYFILCEKFSSSEILVMVLGLAKGLLILLYCQHQTVMMSQSQRHTLYYIIYAVSDAFLISPIIIVVVFHSYLQLSTSYHMITTILHIVVPFVSTSLYGSLSKQSINIQSNTKMVYFYCLWILPLTLRQTLTILLPFLQKQFYLIIDSILLIYSVSMMVYGKKETFVWILQQLQNMRRIKKYKFYIMENLRNWIYDSTNLSQNLFIVNILIFAIGYVKIKNTLPSSSFDQYHNEYLIIASSAILIHILNIYNNYYAQFDIDKLPHPIYSPYYSYAFLFLGSGFYVVFSYFINQKTQQDYAKHQRYSLIVFILAISIIFTNMFGHYTFQTFDQYKITSKTGILVLSYIIFYYPFITVFTVFFYLSNLNKSYIFYFAVGGFAYLTVVSATTGILVHAALNLTEKSKRTLFVIKQVTEEFNRINMKEDPQIISMISNLYDLMDGDSQKLLQQLQVQKLSKIILHDNASIPYDYSFTLPDNKEKQHQIIKVFTDNLNGQGKINSSRKAIKITSIKHMSSKKLQTKIHFYKNSQSNLNLRHKVSLNVSEKVQNKNHLQINRLIESIDMLFDDQREMMKVKRLIDSNAEFKKIIDNQQSCREMMHRFYHFFTYPSESLNFETFSLVLRLLYSKNTQNHRDIFNKHSEDCEQLKEQHFRNFLVRFIEQKSKRKFYDPHSAWKWFIQNYLFSYLIKGNQVFRYCMKRKNVQMSIQSQIIWKEIINQQKYSQMLEYKKKYNMKKFKALGKKTSTISKNIQLSSSTNQQPLQIDEIVQIEQDKVKPEQQKKKHILFLSPDIIYKIIVDTLVESIKKYQKIQHQTFTLETIKFELSNILAILTKIFDFTYLYMYGSIYAMYSYGIGQFLNAKYILSFINYDYVFGLAFLGVVTYICLIIYHKTQFVNGSLGVDQNQRTLSFTSLKYYATFFLFLMGSSLCNLFIMTSLNSYMCEETSATLFNFPENQCYSTIHVFQMFFSLLMLLSYYPLASLIFPFSTAIDRTLEIKYKAEYEIVYLQCKFLVNGINVIFNQIDFKNEQLIKASIKTCVCIILAFLFHKQRPCSVEFINSIEIKIYIGLAIINAAGIMCYFVGLKITIISFGIVLFLYIVYSFASSIKVSDNNTPSNKEESNQLVNERFKKQEVFKIRLRQINNDNFSEAETNSNLYKTEGLYFNKEEESQIDIANESKKFENVNNIFCQETQNCKTQGIRRKQYEKQPTINFKITERKQADIDQRTIISANQNEGEVISAAKRKSQQSLSNAVFKILRKN